MTTTRSRLGITKIVSIAAQRRVGSPRIGPPLVTVTQPVVSLHVFLRGSSHPRLRDDLRAVPASVVEIEEAPSMPVITARMQT